MYPNKRDGPRDGTVDYRFSRLGEPVPVTTEEDFKLDLENLPSRPFAYSELRGLVFIAHLKGFCVAWTKAVISSAVKLKEGGQASCIQKLSIVDVDSLGKVSILALSADSSTLAASVGSKIYFFSVERLLQRACEPSFSKSINGSSCIKDMHWSPDIKDQYVVLTNAGKLYRGAGQNDLSSLLDDVDAVNWSWNGEYLAVAQCPSKNKNLAVAQHDYVENYDCLNIYSSEFEKKVQIKLRFDSLVNGDADCVLKVDSITWVRRNWIILGCYCSSGGKMENHVVNLIWSRLNNITKTAAYDLVAWTFDSPYLAINEDDIPSGSGPYTLVSYLDEFELAFVANKRNTCDHIGLFSNADYRHLMLDIVGGDTWMPTIYSANGDDDNMILGLAIDKVNQDKDDVFVFGENETEVSPCCILMCLTTDGKLFLFNFIKSAIGPSVLPADEEEESTLPSSQPIRDQPKISVTRCVSKVIKFINNIYRSTKNTFGQVYLCCV